MSTENKALLRRWFEEIGFKPFHSAYRNAFPDTRLQIDDIVGEGDTVAARWSGTGTHSGDGLGFPATGKQVHFRGMSFIRVEGGKIAEAWNDFDQLGMLQEIGIVTLPTRLLSSSADAWVRAATGTCRGPRCRSRRPRRTTRNRSMFLPARRPTWPAPSR